MELGKIMLACFRVCVNPLNYVLVLGLDNGTIKPNFAEPHFLIHSGSAGQL